MKTVAFIPARGGSKRLPKKNTILLNGLPLIAYSIRYAKFHGADEIVVSTDDVFIATIAKQEGALVIERPEILSNDTATTSSAAQHTAQELQSHGLVYDCFITLQPTNPLRPSMLWHESLNLFGTKTFDSVMSVSLNERKLGKVQSTEFFATSYTHGQRSQDLEQLYYENGLIYCSDPASVLSDNLFGNHIGVVVTDSHTAVDIDYEYDLWYAELLIQKEPEKFAYYL